MLFNTYLTIAAVVASTAIAAPTMEERNVDARAEAVSASPRMVLIATNPAAACRCPNNCDHRTGSSCKFYTTASSTGPTADGLCIPGDGGLICQPGA